MKNQTKKIGIFLIIASLYIFVFIFYIISQSGFPQVLTLLVQLCALFGLLTLFISSIMATFTKEIYQIFGQPFKKVHHFFAFTGLSLITAHPVFYSILARDAKVFIPVFSSWIAFWTLAGRPALYLIFLAVIAGFLQKRIKNFWRILHGLNYIALVFGVIHGILNGSNMSTSIILQVFFYTLLTLATLAFVFKRYTSYKRKKKRKERKAT